MFLLYWAGQCPPAVSCKSMPVPARYKGKGHWLEQQYFFLLCSYRTYYKIVKSVLLCWRPELQYPTCCASNPTGLRCEIVSFVLGGTMPASSFMQKYACSCPIQKKDTGGAKRLYVILILSLQSVVSCLRCPANVSGLRLRAVRSR